jgi:hypothetical protein
MYFRNFPYFLYDFNYGNGVSRTNVVKDITRNIRFKKEILSNVSLYDEYDIVDGETPEMIAEKFYGTPDYHWIVMLANEKFDYLNDFPMQEAILQRHIKTTFNPTLYSDDWYWDTHEDGRKFIHVRITGGSTDPFLVAFLIAPVTMTLYDSTKKFQKIIHFPTDEIGLDEATQYFYFPYNEPWDITQFGKEGATATSGFGAIRIFVDTDGRENNPIYFVDAKGNRVNPSVDSIPVTGDEIHRNENNKKRRIKIISPALLETVIKNYEELLK